MFRHLDPDQLGHVKPSVLRHGLDRMGSHLTDNEFNTLLEGIGHAPVSTESGDSKMGAQRIRDQDQEKYLNLHDLDVVMHQELAVNHADMVMGAADKMIASMEQAAGREASNAALHALAHHDFRKRTVRKLRETQEREHIDTTGTSGVDALISADGEPSSALLSLSSLERLKKMVRAYKELIELCHYHFSTSMCHGYHISYRLVHWRAPIFFYRILQYAISLA